MPGFDRLSIPPDFKLMHYRQKRQMTKGQQAMAVAMIYPDTEQGKKTSSETEEVSSTRLSIDRTVLEHAPDLARQVLTGSASIAEGEFHENEIRRKRAGGDP